MAKPRKSKLKVFRTPIGFHDAYVAAPSQKAALEAWGSDSNLFAAGAAELVTDAALTPGAARAAGRGDQGASGEPGRAGGGVGGGGRRRNADPGSNPG